MTFTKIVTLTQIVTLFFASVHYVLCYENVTIMSSYTVAAAVLRFKITNKTRFVQLLIIKCLRKSPLLHPVEIFGTA